LAYGKERRSRYFLEEYRFHIKAGAMTLTSKPGATKKRKGERGQNLVEFALVLPIFLVLVFGIVDFGMGLKAWIQVTNAAREAARYAAVTCATDAADVDLVKDRAVDIASGLITAADVTVTNCPGASTESVVVQIDYAYEFVTPLGGMLSILGGGVFPDSVDLSSAADMRLE
jgi:Flp pilus assembly protein TadG